MELGEVGRNDGEENAGGEPNAGGRKADVPKDSLGVGLELNDDRRLSTSITSASVNFFSDFSLRMFSFFQQL